VRQAFEQLGWQIVDFIPALSLLADFQARWQQVETPDLVWVPCFRHRDAAAALRWARSRNVPAVFDPLISAYDKQVFEKERFSEDSARARRLQFWEAALMRRFDAVVADTACHADFYCQCFGLRPEHVPVIPVGAEEELFTPQPFVSSDPVRVLFYGSFIGLQGPEIIAEAARLVPSVHWTFVGDGPLKSRCQSICQSMSHVRFIPWIPYEALPAQIGQAQILLGVFGASQKAGRVIPNKVYQSLACARVVITRESPAYPDELRHASVDATGLQFIHPGSPDHLAAAVLDLAQKSTALPALGEAARASYLKHFSQSAVVQALGRILSLTVPGA
jgi:glycosyltransferase involved in cell wall biosynthesis